MGLSFSTAGAFPTGGTQTTTPQTNNSSIFGQIGSDIRANNNRALGLPSSGTPASNALNNAAGPAPTTPVKRTTVNNVDGSSTSTEYHAPITPPVAPQVSAPITPGVLPAQKSPFQVDPTSLPALSGGNYGANQSAQGNYTSYNADGTTSVHGNGGTTQNVTPTTTMSAPTTFGGIVGSLAGTSQNGSQGASQSVSGLLGAPAQNATIGQSAADIASSYGQKISDVGQKGAQFEGGQLTTGTSPVAEGNAAVTANTTANEQNALATGEQAALQGTAQQLTAQNQGQSGLTNAGSIANTQQSNTQSGLESAGSLAQPTSNFPFKFDPLTGSFTNAAGASTGALTYNSTNDAATLAKEVINNQIPYSDAVTAMGYAPNGVGTGALQQAIVQAGGNIAQLEGQAAASQSNAQTQGVTGTNIAAQGLTGATEDYQDMLQVNNAADSNATNVKQILDATGLNSSNSNDYTKTINSLSGRLGSAQVTSLNTAITELQNTYSQLLNSGGTTPTGSEAQALAVLNPNSSAAQINAAIQQLQTAATNKLSAASQKAQNYQTSLGGSNSNSSTNSGTVQTKYGSINTGW